MDEGSIPSSSTDRLDYQWIMEIVKYSSIKDKIIKLRDTNVILDCDVAWYYEVETKEVNQAVKNNPEKFPNGYIINLKNSEFHDLRSKFLTTNFEKTRVVPKAFTEKGLYMLATILKSKRATQATIDIIEAFAQLRELQKTVEELSAVTDETQQKTLMQKSGEIMSEIMGNNLKTTETETSIEVDFSILRFKHTVKRNN